MVRKTLSSGWDRLSERSQEGVQQGDPLGPLLFAMVVQSFVLNEWYLDDGRDIYGVSWQTSRCA